MKISWFTNVAAPYRTPIWEHMEQSHELQVHLLESGSSLAREGRRPTDWGQADLDRYRHIPNFTLRRGERSFYFARRVSLLPSGVNSVLIGAWESPVYFQVLLEAKLRSVRTVGFYESTLMSNTHRAGPIAAARSRFFRSLDAVVVPGEAAEEALLSFGVDYSRIHRGFNAVDVERFHAASASRPVTRSPADGHRFVFVGQLIERKNPDLLLEAFASIAAPVDTLTFIGVGNLLESLETRSVDLGVRDKVDFQSHRTNHELADTLAYYDTLVLPSAQEVWGLVVNEGLAAGLKVVVSSAAGAAPSVAGMEGVIVADPLLPDLVRALRTARATGPSRVKHPEILQYTPQRFAGVFLDALKADE